ncbi:MAG: hypothetical protein Q6358_07990 [Candidatus Brocadiales bacterium]|nr:hypothetical protein [Candidatus Brocadiales bacterium]
MEFKELFKGIDSLYVSYKGILKEGLKELLEEKKKLAQSDSEREQALAVITIEQHNFEVKDKGGGKYSYILVDSWYQIQISASKKGIVPTVYVQIKSELLNCFGPYYSVYKLREIVDKLLIVIVEESISRADIFVDFVTDMDLENIDKQSWVTMAKDTTKHWKGKVFTGLSIGMGGVIYARLYDKTVEIEKSGKYYLKEFWDKMGWDKKQSVWRLEFQLKREFLGQMSATKFSDILERINDIWRYCTCDWLRLAIDDKTINRTRWKIYPLWEMIQQVRFMEGVSMGIKREVDMARIPSDKTLFQNGVGYITAFVAREGYDSLDEETIKKFLAQAKSYLKEKTFGNCEAYLETKINLKKKRYNKVENKITDHTS